MNTAKLMTVAVIATLIVGSGAYAFDYSLTVVQHEQNLWTYTLTNSSATRDVIAWTLHWNPNDFVEDDIQAQDYFDIYNGVIKPLPARWYQIGGDFPSFGVFEQDEDKAIKHGGNSLGGFTIKFGTQQHPEPVLPGWFTVSYRDNGQYRTSEMMPVPEPGSAFGLFSGLAGGLFMLGRRRSR